MIAILLEDILIELGYEVVGPVARVDKAVERVKHDAPNAAILDVNLNGEEVYPVAEILAARGIPFLFVTGYGSGGLRPSYGDRPTLLKPFRRRDVERALARLRQEAEIGFR